MPQWLIRISTPRRSICAHGISWLPTERPLVGGQFYTPTTNAEAKANAVRVVRRSGLTRAGTTSHPTPEPPSSPVSFAVECASRAAVPLPCSE